jgi:hypothetical protein
MPMPMSQPKVRKVGSMGRLKKFIGFGRRGRTAVDTGPWT